jgi:protein-S-isoprenylcysteine O-methyltransferase Ste14
MALVVMLLMYLVAIRVAIAFTDRAQQKWPGKFWLGGAAVAVVLSVIFVASPGYLNTETLSGNLLKSTGAVLAASVPVVAASVARSGDRPLNVAGSMITGLLTLPVAFFLAMWFSCMAGDCL